MGLALLNLGLVMLRQGRLERPRLLFQRALTLSQSLGSADMLSYALLGLGGAYILDGRHVQGARLLGAAVRLSDQVGHPFEPIDRPDYDQFVNTAQAALGDDHFSALFADGTALTLEQAVAYALDDA